VSYVSDSVEQTEAIAAELAQSLRGGDFVALDGELGAGKTQFVRGLVAGLGGNPRAVSSPTYILLNVYPTGKLTVYHLDAFRISSPADLEAIGFSELLQQGQVVVVEWASRAVALLPDRRIEIKMDVLSESSRRIAIRRIGPT
jgi:tRNA threonylcarbamoyladenosine biosynthesis protein TsaE